MVDKGIILPVRGGDYDSFVIREKSGGRLCIHLASKDPNKVIKRKCHPVPTVDGITLRPCEATQFFKLDAAQGYWNIVLVRES